MSKGPFIRKPGCGDFGKRLKEERVRRGFKVGEFSKMAGISESQLTAAENRGSTPNFWHVVEMAKILDCSLDWLAGIGK